MKIQPTFVEVKEIAATGHYNVLPVSLEILSDFTTPMEDTSPIIISPTASRPSNVMWKIPRHLRMLT